MTAGKMLLGFFAVWAAIMAITIVSYWRGYKRNG